MRTQLHPRRHRDARHDPAEPHVDCENVRAGFADRGRHDLADPERQHEVGHLVQPVRRAFGGPVAGEKPSFRRFDEMRRRNVEIIGRFASFFVLELILRVPKLCSWLNAVHYIKPIIRR
ncbi:hypothetical protein [Burkholderia sp. AU4i]|uniref:hypothetical protein n=1 Tax=Burkholderia sp. AU4i TaxID=1335308 RepID=UPI0012DD4C08|nr:hypothetical protein [Burkholderia sp. AU4i]